MDPLVIAMTGASGAPYALRLIEVLLEQKIPIHLTISPAGAQVLWQECQLSINLDEFQPEKVFPNVSDFNQLTYHSYQDFMTPIASGSFCTRGMVVVPCSGSTLGGIATGTSGNLIHRAADVHLKERRKLVLVTRETPLSLVHINNMKTVTEAGAVVMPAMPGWYHGVNSLEDLIDFMVSRILDQFGIENHLMRRWGSQ